MNKFILFFLVTLPLALSVNNIFSQENVDQSEKMTEELNSQQDLNKNDDISEVTNVDQDTKNNPEDDFDLDDQTYGEVDDDFVPSEEIPADEPIPFPTNI